jgi:hypothetical protein
MKEMAMLDLTAVDLGDLAVALEDHTEFGRSWWIDGHTGEVWMWSSDLDADPEFDPDARDDARVPGREAHQAVTDARIVVQAVEARMGHQP